MITTAKPSHNIWIRGLHEKSQPIVRRKQPIVHCKDCEHFDSYYGMCHRPVLYFDDDHNPHWTNETDFFAVAHAEPDGFCAWGERKDNGCEC